MEPSHLELGPAKTLAPALSFYRELSFTDRTGTTVLVKIVGVPQETGDGASVWLVLTAGGVEARGRSSVPGR